MAAEIVYCDHGSVVARFALNRIGAGLGQQDADLDRLRGPRRDDERRGELRGSGDDASFEQSAAPDIRTRVTDFGHISSLPDLLPGICFSTRTEDAPFFF